MGCVSSQEKRAKEREKSREGQYRRNNGSPSESSPPSSSRPGAPSSTPVPQHHSGIPKNTNHGMVPQKHSGIPNAGRKLKGEEVVLRGKVYSYPPRPHAPRVHECSQKEYQSYLNTYQMLPPGLALEEEGNQEQIDDAQAKDNTAAYHKMQGGGRRCTISDAPFNAKDMEKYTPKAIPKEPHEQAELQSILKCIAMLAHLDDRELMSVVSVMDHGVYREGELIYKESDFSDQDKFYVIQSGAVSLERGGRQRKTVQRGQYFGETELMCVTKRTDSVRTVSAELRTWELSRMDYRHLLRQASVRKRKHYVSLLSKVDFLSRMDEGQMATLADCLQPAKYKNSEKIISYGSEGEWMHIILEGSVEVIGRVNGNPVRVCEFREGDIVGELEFLDGRQNKCVADVKAIGNVRTAKLQRNHFELCMGPVKDLIKENRATNPKFHYYNNEATKG